MIHIKNTIDSFNAWMDASLDNRCCVGLTAIGLGFGLNLFRMWAMS